MNKVVVILIGMKGSGKTHIGAVVSQHMNIVFLRVEPLWLSLASNEDGWSKVEREVDQILNTADSVMIESLGGTPCFDRLLANLSAKYCVKLVRVYADQDTCLRRVRTRNNEEHIPVSDHQVIKYNEMASKVVMDWDAEIDNSGPATTEDILQVVRTL